MKHLFHGPDSWQYLDGPTIGGVMLQSPHMHLIPLTVELRGELTWVLIRWNQLFRIYQAWYRLFHRVLIFLVGYFGRSVPTRWADVYVVLGRNGLCSSNVGTVPNWHSAKLASCQIGTVPNWHDLVLILRVQWFSSTCYILKEDQIMRFLLKKMSSF